MRVRSLLVAALLAFVAAPAGAQQYQWNPDRPDAAPPFGMYAAQTLQDGEFRLKLIASKLDHEFVRFDSRLVDPSLLLGDFQFVPFDMVSHTYMADIALGLSDNLTLTGRIGFMERSRLQIDEDLEFFELESDGITDLEVDVLFDVYESGSYRAHVGIGAVVPTGPSADQSESPFRGGTLPYDMQIGGGGWGVKPSVAISVMNEVASVGAQLSATKFFGDKDGWRQGDRVDAALWAAYRLNRFFSVSAGARASGFGAIEGQADGVDVNRDPGEVNFAYDGERVDIPIGLNFYMPEGSLEGNRLSIELLYTVHEQFESVWIARDVAFAVGWEKTF